MFSYFLLPHKSYADIDIYILRKWWDVQSMKISNVRYQIRKKNLPKFAMTQKVYLHAPKCTFNSDPFDIRNEIISAPAFWRSLDSYLFNV